MRGLMPLGGLPDTVRILILSSFLPYEAATHAGGIVLFRMIEGLSRRHELSLISFVSSNEEVHQARALSELGVSVETIAQANTSTTSDLGGRVAQRLHSLLLSRLPYEAWRFRSRAMADAITQAVEGRSFDIVQAEFTQMGQYANRLRDHPRTLLREYDLSYVLRQRRMQTAQGPVARAYHWVQWQRTRSYELGLYPRFRKILVPSEPIKAELLAQLPNLDVTVVPFGVTLSELPPSREPPDSKRVLFVGAMGRSLNIEAVRCFHQQTWPRVVSEEPEAELWIVGSDPPPAICQLAESDDRVIVSGYVSDLAPVYASASVFIAPLPVGGGVVTKILDALAMSRAVVATSVANEGIGAADGRDLLLADEPAAFADVVVDLLRDPARRSELGRNGRRFVEQHFSWESIIERLEMIYDGLMR